MLGASNSASTHLTGNGLPRDALHLASLPPADSALNRVLVGAVSLGIEQGVEQSTPLKGTTYSADADSLPRLLKCALILTEALTPHLENPSLKDPVNRVAVTKPDKEWYLSERIKNGSWGDLTSGQTSLESTLRKVAELVVKFHFDDAACPIVAEDLGDLLTKKIIEGGYRKIDTVLTKQGEVITRERDWFYRMGAYLVAHKDFISEAASRLNEPIRGFGDITLSNVVSLPDGRVAIVNFNDEDASLIGLTPTPSDFVRTRRMDARLLKSELELLGMHDAAEAYWQAYEQAYQACLVERQQTYLPGSDIALGVRAIDVLGDFYRFVLAYTASISNHDAVVTEAATARINRLLNTLS